MAKINYTPYANHTDSELMREVCSRDEVTDLEIELMHRLEYWVEYAAALEERLEIDVHAKVATRYKEDAYA